MINGARIGLMRKGGAVLNFARADIVDEAAIIAALESGRLSAYVCDFPSAAIKNRHGVVALPHLGASTSEAEENCAMMVADTLRDYLEHGNIRHSVNFPESALPRVAATSRLAIANSNVPNMVGQISTCLADAGLNIADLLNKSKGEVAYTLIDIDGKVPPGLIERIGGIAGVLCARAV
jgi:D-3-phosphoglycerate dehydrogenase